MSGEGEIEEALLDGALLRSIHDQVVAGMNAGKRLEDIIREMDWPSTDKPWLRPIYDHPEFIARNVYRLYGGWWDHNPANMLPAHRRRSRGRWWRRWARRPSSSGRGVAGRWQPATGVPPGGLRVQGGAGEPRGGSYGAKLFEARAAAEESLMARGRSRRRCGRLSGD